MGLPFTEEQFEKYAAAIQKAESGSLGKRVVNKFGFAGLYQMGALALNDAGFVKPHVRSNKELRNPENWNIEGGLNSFLEDENLQKEAFRKYTELNYNRITKLDEFNSFSGDTSELAGLLATAHLKGVNGGAKKFLQGEITRDGFNTPTSKYYDIGKNALLGSLDKVKPKTNIFIGSQQPSDVFGADMVNKVVQDDSGPSFTESFQASRRESPILKYLDRPSTVGTFDPQYNPFNDLEGYEAFADDFVDIPNKESADALKQYIDESLEQQSKQQGLGGLLGGIAYGLLSPTTLIPGIGLASKTIMGGSLGARILGGGLLTGAAAGADEVMLTAIDPTRTKTESFLNTTAATALGGLLFGAVGSNVKMDPETRKRLSSLLRDEGGTIEVKKKATLESTQGTKESAKDAIEAVAGRAVGKGFMKFLSKTSPKLRLMTSPIREVRAAASKLMEHNFVLGKNMEDIASDVPVERIIETEVGKVHSVLHDVSSEFKRYKQEGDFSLGTSRADFESGVYKAIVQNRKHANPFIEASRKRVNRYLKDLGKKLHKEGLLPEGFDKYHHLLRRFDSTAIIADRKTFTNIIQNTIRRQFKKINKEINLKTARLEAEKVVDNIERKGLSPTEYLKVQGEVLDLRHSDIESFLDTDFTAGITSTAKKLESEIAFKQTFGEGSMKSYIEKLTKSVNKRIDELKDGADKNELTNRLKADIRDLEAIRDRIQGRYRLPEDPYSLGSVSLRALSSISYMSKGGGIAISQIADLGNLLIASRMPKILGKEVKSFGRMLKGMKLSKADLRELGVGMETWLSSRAAELGDITDIQYRQSKLDKVLNAMTQKFQNVSLINQMNDFTRRFSANHVANNMILDLQKFKLGKLSEKRRIQLRRLGLKDSDITNTLKQFEKHSEVVDGVRIANMHKWNRTADKFRYAVRSEVDNIILMPDAGDRPLWMSSEVGKVIGQFTGFSFAMTNKVLIPGLSRFDSEFLSRIVLLTFMGAASVAVRDTLKGRDFTNRNLDEVFKAAIEKGGVTGVLGDIHGRFETFTGLGIGQVMSEAQRARYYKGDRWAAVLGPGAGLIEDIADSVPGLFTGEPTQQEIKKLIRSMPFQNLFYTHWLMSMAHDKIEKELPKSRK